MSSTATTSSSNRHGTDVIAAALVQHELAVRSCHGIEVPVPGHVLPQAVELRDQVAAVLLGCGRESAVVEFGERYRDLTRCGGHQLAKVTLDRGPAASRVRRCGSLER